MLRHSSADYTFSLMGSCSENLRASTDREELTLTLSSPKPSNLIEFLSPTPTFNRPHDPPQGDVFLPLVASRSRRNPHYGPPKGKEGTIHPPFKWSSNRRAVVHTKDYLLYHGIRDISGEMECKKCTFREMITYDIEENFSKLAEFLSEKDNMYERAPAEWMKPTFPACPGCPFSGFLRPVVAAKKRDINWLFLSLGQMLGVCTLEQLKYFCKHNMIHRTGSKERLLFFTYIRICKQLDPKEFL